MSLADLPIENLALIQAFFAANIEYFDTRIVNLCRVTRAKMTAHTWPTLYANNTSPRTVATTLRYKFADMIVIDGDTCRILRMIHPHAKIAPMYIDGCHVLNGVCAYNADISDVVVKSSTVVFTAPTGCVRSECPYKLIIMPRWGTVRINLVGTMPTSIEIGGHEHYPYVRMNANVLYIVQILVNSIRVYDKNIMGREYIRVQHKEMMNTYDKSSGYWNKFRILDPLALRNLIQSAGVDGQKHIDNIIEYTMGRQCTLHLPLDINLDNIIAHVHAGVVKSIQ